MDLSNLFIDFKKQRMVNAILVESMLFMRQNFKLYISFILKYCGIPVFAASYLYVKTSLANPEIIEQISIGKLNPDQFLAVLPSFVLPFILLFVSQIFFYSLVYGHIQQYIERKTAEIPNAAILKSGVRRFHWQLIGFVLLVVLFLALLVIITMLGKSTQGLSFFALAGVIYLLVPMGLVSPILFFEKDGGFNSAFARAMFLIRNSWLHLITAFFMSFCVVVSITIILGIPIQLISSGLDYVQKNISQSILIQTLIQTIGNMVSLFAFSFIIIAGSMIYFSQVDKLDKKERDF